jgi:solute carrier family 25 (mitochondrial citrate transporter), member 1
LTKHSKKLTHYLSLPPPILPTNSPVVTGPMDVIKTRLMAQNKAAALAAGKEPAYRGLLDALVKIPREEGIRALWKGLLPRLMRIPPGQAIVWGVSDQITGVFERRARERREGRG